MEFIKQKKNSRIFEIFKNIYWVGGSDTIGGLHCNPYLLVDNDESVLFDPGSILDFEYVFENVCSLTTIDKIKYVVLHHQDPDFCSSVPLFEKKGCNFKVITHWRTKNFIEFYGIKSDYYIVNENKFKINLKSGRKLDFIQTPYLHFPGAITTYDEVSKILFSSDIFGAFSSEWNLFAKENYIEEMKTFHEHYMPSNEILRPVMENFLNMDIKLIAPQHGSIINKDIKKHIKILRDLECGIFIKPIKKELAKNGGYLNICSLVIKRYCSIYKKEEVLNLFESFGIHIDEKKLKIRNYDYSENNLWDIMFENILSEKGISWLVVIEPLVEKLSKEYDIPIPKIFETELKKAEINVQNLNKENELLKSINDRLNLNIQETEEKLTKCQVTNLYNYDFFKKYLSTEMLYIFKEKTAQIPSLIILNIDDIERLEFKYGEEEINQILKNIVYILDDFKDDNSILFRLQGYLFGIYIHNISKNSAVNLSENIRNEIRISEKFIEKITVSIGIVSFEEIDKENSEYNDNLNILYDIAMMRVMLAKKMGTNLVCKDSEIYNYQENIGNILIVDKDKTNIDVLKSFLEYLKFNVKVATDGLEAINICNSEKIDLVISEINVLKYDGFSIKENLMKNSNTKNIPFILLSHVKNEASVERALNLEIEHYFKKPYMISEIIGLIKFKVRGELFR